MSAHGAGAPSDRQESPPAGRPEEWLPQGSAARSLRKSVLACGVRAHRRDRRDACSHFWLFGFCGVSLPVRSAAKPRKASPSGVEGGTQNLVFLSVTYHI